MKQSKKFLCGFFAAASLLMTPVSVVAQSYPTKPIRIVFPFAPGGGGDFVARFIAQRLSETLRQNVYVENRPGAGGLTGSDMAIREPADGYTLLLISNSYTVNPSIYNVKFDPVTGITPIARISEGPLLIVANPSFKPSTTRELIAAAKAAPGKLNFASGGMGSEIVARLNEAIQKILKMPETAQRLESEGVVPAVDGTPAKFEALIKAEVGIWAKVAAAAGIKKPD